ncbi:Positive regulator of purine utilization [Cytospora mali]|uniref:Positive regulator of purine utilization n=1 Tax=Cytospora mali TaxID=578113 RepID=A0A194W5H1_CYTMA|nr:Positive regulator of purine utilization [Valsa mali]
MSMQWNPAPAEAINDLMRADLDQLYFDRVHAFVPMVHRRRYSSWAKQGAKSDIQVCLQQSMWALAASLSAQYQHMCDLLYMQTRHTLELLDARQDGSESLEANQIQAWLLITMFEFMRTNSQRACVSAGRSFRLIQLARFYEIDLHGSDGPGSSGAQSPDAPAQTTWINVEEQRRTFWCAYILDRLISLRNDCPLTLSEQLIATRVPSSELDFQNGRPSFTGFLSELISSPLAPSQRSIFTELIVWSTVCGRVMTHKQQSIVERIYNNPSQGFWDRHQWLDSVISQRTQIFLLQYPDAAEHEDPLLLFVSMMSKLSVLNLYRTMESAPWDTENRQLTGMTYKARSLTAAQEMGKLVKILGHLSCFMVHPFTAVALAGWADFLSGSKDQDPVSEADFQDILSALRELKSVNNLAADYLRVYE